MTSLRVEHVIDAPKKTTHLSYRPDIDGLRALAVLPVIFFHAGISAFSGGYLGVDVFFVISGYLITSIIIKEKQANAFKLRSFYMRRAKRILPVLLCVISLTTIGAWKLLPPKELDYFAQSVIATLTFSSNILFWMQSGYFDTATELKPLLHTWSLAAEEQYYIIFPLIILALWKSGRKIVVTAIALLLIASAAFSTWLTSVDQVASFYLLPARAWEILAGALVALVGAKIPAHPLQKWASPLGLILVTAPFFLYDSDTALIPLYAAPTVIGTVLVIQFTKPNSLAYRFLTLRPMILMGLISYSAYLWHQPLLAFAKFRYSHDLPTGIIFMIIGATTVLSIISYKLIENPARKTRGFKSTALLSVIITCGAALAFAAFVTQKNQGYPIRMQKFYSTNAQALEQALETKFTLDSQESEYYKATPAPEDTILIIGDSYVRNWSVGLNENINHSKYRVIAVNFLHCEVASDNETITSTPMSAPYEKNCREFAEYTNNSELLKTVKKIFLVSHRPFEYQANLFRFDILATLQKKTGAHAYIFGNYYQLDPQINATCMSAMFSFSRGPDICVERASWPPEKQATTSSAVPKGLKYTFVDVIDLLCGYNKPKCPSNSEGVPYLVEDWNHLSMSFTKQIFKTLKTENKSDLESINLADIFR